MRRAANASSTSVPRQWFCRSQTPSSRQCPRKPSRRAGTESVVMPLLDRIASPTRSRSSAREGCSPREPDPGRSGSDRFFQGRPQPSAQNFTLSTAERQVERPEAGPSDPAGVDGRVSSRNDPRPKLPMISSANAWPDEDGPGWRRPRPTATGGHGRPRRSARSRRRARRRRGRAAASGTDRATDRR